MIDWPGRERDTRFEQGVLDRDLLGSPLVLRNWRPGDSFRPRGRRSAHKLKHFLRANRVALRDRAGWPVLTSRETWSGPAGFRRPREFAPARPRAPEWSSPRRRFEAGFAARLFVAGTGGAGGPSWRGQSRAITETARSTWW